jgi:hypothetical protein
MKISAAIDQLVHFLVGQRSADGLCDQHIDDVSTVIGEFAAIASKTIN